MTDKILNPVIARMLKEMERVFQLHSVDFYLVGAMARDIQLSSKPGYGAIRGTKDVDLAILLVLFTCKGKQESLQTLSLQALYILSRPLK